MINLKDKKERKNTIRRIVSLTMALLMVLSVIASAVTSMTRVYAVSPEAVEKQELEKLELVTDSLYARQGENSEKTITVRNNGHTDLTITSFNSEVTDSSGDLVLTFKSDNNVTVPAGKKADITGTLSVADDAERKKYVSRDLTFYFDNGESVTRDMEYRVNVITVNHSDDIDFEEIEGSIAQPMMEIAMASSTPEQCWEGQKIDIIALLSYDKSTISEQSTSVTISGDGFDVVDGMITRSLEVAKTSYSGKEKHTRAIAYELQAKEDLASGYYPVTITVNYYDDEETAKYTSTNTYNIYINGSKNAAGGDVAAATPFLIVEQYDYGTDDVVAGDTFDLRMSIKNTGYLAVENILVAITAPNELAITSSSNTLYIDRLSAGESLEKIIQFRAKGSADPGSHAINVKFSYQYLDNDSRKAGNTEENIAIPVIQQDRFFVNDLEPPMMMYTGQDNYIDVTFINKGTTDVRNISAEIAGENLVQPGQSQYIGNLTPGEENSASFTIQSMMPGMLNGQVILSYEDSNGTQKEVIKEFTVEVMEYIMPDYGDMGMVDPGYMEEPMDEGFKMPVWGWALIGVGGVIAVIVVVSVVVKKKKAKKAQEEEDEDF